MAVCCFIQNYLFFCNSWTGLLICQWMHSTYSMWICSENTIAYLQSSCHYCRPLNISLYYINYIEQFWHRNQNNAKKSIHCPFNIELHTLWQCYWLLKKNKILISMNAIILIILESRRPLLLTTWLPKEITALMVTSKL